MSAKALNAVNAHMVLFTIGQGTPFGALAQTVKIATNNTLATPKVNWNDFNVGIVADGEQSIEETAGELMRFVLAVAFDGPTKTEEKGFREISVFKDGVTLYPFNVED